MTLDSLMNGALENALRTLGSVREPMRPSSNGTTGTLGLAHGACGVAHVLTQTGREVPAQLLEWMDRQPIDAARYTPGLMGGLAGIAWTFWEIGLTDKARQLMSSAFSHARLFDRAGMYSGSSGVGMVALWMYVQSKERQYVDKAREIAEYLSATGRRCDRGVCWPASDLRVSLGYGDGASGVAAFLLYLYLSTGEWRWLTLGRQALEFELWQMELLIDVPQPRCGPRRGILPLCWEHGTAGIAAVLGRYYAVLGHPTYEAALHAIVDWSACNGVRCLGYFDGLAGIGQSFLDIAILCRCSAAERCAVRIAEAIASLAIPDACGYASAMSGNRGDICDFATGAAGVALFLHRLQTRETSSFMLDDLFDRDQLRGLV